MNAPFIHLNLFEDLARRELMNDRQLEKLRLLLSSSNVPSNGFSGSRLHNKSIYSYI